MYSAKSHAHKEKRQGGHFRREHKNKAFYNSTAWKSVRLAYIKTYQELIDTEIPTGKWQGIDIDQWKVSYILQLDSLPCEICLKLFVSDAYDEVDAAYELDHIVPVNPDNALEREGYGEPFSFDNLQYICKRHHSKKSQRER